MTSPAPASAAPPSPAVAPAPRRGRRGWGWLWIGALLLVVGGIGAAIAATGERPDRGAFDPDSAGPDGTRALVQILRDQGVDVRVVRDRAAAHATLDRSPATLIMPDSAYLSDDAVAELAHAAADTVVVSVTSRIARVLFPGTTLAGLGPAQPIDPACEATPARRAGPIVAGTMFDPGSDTAATACYLDAGRAALLQRTDGAATVSLIDGSGLFTNTHLAEHGNAALALNLMGRHPVAVWYVPSPADSDLTDDAPSLGELTPGWVTPVMTLLVVTTIVAAIWRGRRFGPLVVENLPVTVRASETMEGRARLAARSGDAAGALDALRLAALDRLAALLGLGPAADAGAVADACAERTGAPRDLVRSILIDHVPTGDADLVDAADRLRDLETAVRDAARPGRNP